MTAGQHHQLVLAEYPEDCRPGEIQSLGSAGGFSGAAFWRVTAPRGRLCLRRWPREHPSEDGLEFIHAVLQHVWRQGFSLIPLPLKTSHGKGHVKRGQHLWELAPWMPGTAAWQSAPDRNKLTAALVVLAEFHRAAATFPHNGAGHAVSPGIVDRLGQLRRWMAGGKERLAESIGPDRWPDLHGRAHRILGMCPAIMEGVAASLVQAARSTVPLQPCLRDVWHDHVLFEGSRVSGLIDFGAMRVENISADVARLLGSMARDDPAAWQTGLEAYESVRPLGDVERELVVTFDRSTVLMSGLNWLEWIFQQRREFADRGAVASRLDDIIDRLAHLAGLPGRPSPALLTQWAPDR